MTTDGPNEEWKPSISERAQQEAESAQSILKEEEKLRRIELSERMALTRIRMAALDIQARENLARALQPLRKLAEQGEAMASCMKILEMMARETLPIDEEDLEP